MINKTELIKLTKSLIGIPSSYFNENDIMNHVNSWFKKNGINSQIHEYEEKKVTGFKGKNVIVILEGSKPGPTICLNGHLDTVNLCNGWTKDPYEGKIEGDKIYGLGALDMKSGCASLMIAIKEFSENNKLFNGKIIGAFVSVEEGPYGMGTNAMIEEGLLDNIDFSIITEPSAGFTKKEFPVLCLGARGGFGLEIEVFGKSAHAAFPNEGKSAALDASKIICELENVDYISDEVLGKGAACVVAVESDGGACSVPDYAKIKLFWHIVVGEDEKSIEKEIDKAVKRADIKCDYKVKFREAPSPGSKGFMPYKVSKENPMVGDFMESVAEICGEKPEIDYFQSIGDFNYLGSRLNAPAIIFGPSGENFHGIDEYANLDSVEKTSATIYNFLVKTLVD